MKKLQVRQSLLALTAWLYLEPHWPDFKTNLTEKEKRFCKAWLIVFPLYTVIMFSLYHFLSVLSVL